ncbi:Enhancer of mRNA-decapping protein 3 [Operophtera brumata]|uniref:Enhancer of mRNA-decapping protein 3 n=1 Tax=Operophtera brumata TaxID=104452 RepID=A0A0L7L7B1_OPEBR|nr:Enhancer of mRNA-decapping protein 3 [Operophtera brumata]
MSKWVGYAVSVNCGETLGSYQGTIMKADGTTLTLTKAFRNGFPYPKSQVTLNAADIKDLRIIEARSERAETHSTVSASAPAAGRKSRATACFGDAAEPALDDNFDFEGNLALFDKRAIWASMRHSKPDLVRTADDSKFRHDENVLGPAAVRRAMRVPDELRGPMDYVTDEGVTVPAVAPALRKQLWEGLQRHGLVDFALAMVSRAACDVALRLRELAALALDNVPLHARADTLPAAPDLVLVALYDPLADNALDHYEFYQA